LTAIKSYLYKPLTKVNKWLLAMNVCCVFISIIAMLAPYVSPQTWALPAIFNLGFTYIYIANVLFMLLWIIQIHGLFFLSCIVLIVGFSATQNIIGTNLLHTKVSNNANKLRIMSYNVKVFDLYNWTHNTETRLDILSTLLDNKADVINLQEFYTSPTAPHHNHDTLLETTGYFAHLKITKVANNNDYFGIVTYSKFPIINTGVIEFEKNANNIAIFTDVVVNEKDTLRLYNCHLQSVHFKKTDFKFLQQLRNGIADTNYNTNLNSIYSRLTLAYSKRAAQVEQLKAAIKTSPYRVVLTGDCNDVPNSYTYKNLTNAGLIDAFIERGFGFGKTYTASFPPLRIDYIMHSNTLKCSQFDILPSKASDHYPIVAELEL
jgi:endonuclease/exonuclease/phosphatase family metal-dependent hydrolase